MANYWVLCSKSNTKKERGAKIENVGYPERGRGTKIYFGWVLFVLIHCGVKRKINKPAKCLFLAKVTSKLTRLLRNTHHAIINVCNSFKKEIKKKEKLILTASSFHCPI